MKKGGKPGMEGIGKLTAGQLMKLAPGPHLDAESLAAFAENALPDAERARALMHMADCAECREIVFLAQPQIAESQRVFTSARGRSVVLFRWAAGLASVTVVAGGVFLANHELLHKSAVTARQENGPQIYGKVSEEKAAPQLEPQREASALPAARTKAEANGRPEPKHMTAKLKGTMQFDSNDQIHMANAPAPPEALNLQAQNGNETGFRDLAAPAPTPSGYALDKAQAGKGTSAAAANAEVSLQPKAAKNGAVESAGAERVAARAVGGPMFGFMKIPPAQWSLSPGGAVQRSFDKGKSWREVPIQGAQSGFRAVFSSGTQVWAGGNAGALYHSTDSGLTWAKVTPASDERKLSGDIVHIEFADAQNGKVSTDGGEVWVTADGGETWAPQN